MYYYFFAVAMVQSEKSGSWGVESVTGEFEILDHSLDSGLSNLLAWAKSRSL
jgi:hypothetical protein